MPGGRQRGFRDFPQGRQDRPVRETCTVQLAKKLIAQTCEREHIKPGQLTLHADRGSSMTSKEVWINKPSTEPQNMSTIEIVAH